MAKILCVRCDRTWEEDTHRTDGRLCDACKRERICDHKWVDMEDGSYDKFCVRCSKKAKQAVMAMPLNINVNINNEQDIISIAKELNKQINKYMRMNSPFR